MSSGRDWKDQHRDVAGQFKPHHKPSGFQLFVARNAGGSGSSDGPPASNKKRRLPTYPEGHRPFMGVKDPGSSCSNCRYISSDKKRCGSPHFQAFYGGSTIPFPPGHDAHNSCSDWWEG